MKRKILSILLCLSIAISLISFPAYAGEAPTVTGFSKPSFGDNIAAFTSSIKTDIETNIMLNIESAWIFEGSPENNTYNELYNFGNGRSSGTEPDEETFIHNKTYTVIFTGSNANVIAAGETATISGVSGAESCYAFAETNNNFSAVLITFTVSTPEPAVTGFAKPEVGTAVEDYLGEMEESISYNLCDSYEIALAAGAPEDDSFDALYDFDENSETLDYEEILSAGETYTIIMFCADKSSIIAHEAVLPLTITGADSAYCIGYPASEDSTYPDILITFTLDRSITKGADSKQTKGQITDIDITCDGDISRLKEIQVDGTAILNYAEGASNDKASVVSGSTVLTLKKAYLETLSTGEHTVSFVYNNGSISTKFTVESDIPKTGDNAETALYLTALLASAAAIAFLFCKKKAIA